MIREILPGVYQSEIPMPNNPLKALNSYLIKGNRRNLLVDTGFNLPECYTVQIEFIEELGLNWADIDFFISHLHADHSGLVSALATEASKIFCSEIDGDIIECLGTKAYWDAADAFYEQIGYPPDYFKAQRGGFQKSIPAIAQPFSYLNESDILHYGGYHFECIMTPGHTPGHICLYEPKKKFLLAGDTILSGISPNITIRLDYNDALGDYLNSLDKLDAMEIDMVLPGHRGIIYDHHSRIAELKEHHRVRLDEVMVILNQGPMNGYQVANRMHWDMTYNTWDDVSIYQQWFATGEAVAHLEHLYRLRLIEKKQVDHKILYQLPSSR